VLDSQEGLILSGSCLFGFHNVECLDFKIKSEYVVLYGEKEEIQFPSKTEEK